MKCAERKASGSLGEPQIYWGGRIRVSEPQDLQQAPANEATGHDAPGEGALGHDAHGEGAVALRNGLRLAVSLGLTWSVALIVTFRLPRYMGPEMTGKYNVAEAAAATLAVFLNLGADTYVQREVPVRPKHMSDFFGGVVAARILVLMPLLAYAAWDARAEAADVRLAMVVFGIAQLFMAMNETFAKALQASTHVKGLAIANVVAKVLWGVGAFAAVGFGAPLVMLVVPLAIAEITKCVFVAISTRRAIDLEMKFSVRETVAVLRESFPFYVSHVAVALGAALDTYVLGKMQPKTEVGYYGAARKIAALSMLLSPILSGVLIPMMRRAYERSAADFERILRRCIEGTTIVALPFTLLLSLGADLWIRLALGAQFAPAAESLRYLAPTFVFTYTNVLLWLALMIKGRSWTITLISLFGLALLPALIILIVPLVAANGPGAAGMGVAIALSSRELVLALVFLAFLGKQAVDARGASQIAKSLLCCLLVGAAHHAMRPLGHARLAVDAALYIAFALSMRVFKPSDAKGLIKLVRTRGR